MTLTEAIEHAEERARRCYTWVEEVGDPAMKRCGDEHMQLAEWLKDYKRMLEEQKAR